MTDQELIAKVEEIVGGGRIESPKISSRWIVWGASRSPQTMQKFIGRVKRDTRQPAFCRDGKFGVMRN